MTAPDLLTIQLPRDAAELVERNVAPGEYPSASDVISESLRLLAERDKSLDRWLRDDVLGGHAEYLADRDRGVLAGEILQRIHHRRALKKLG